MFFKDLRDVPYVLSRNRVVRQCSIYSMIICILSYIYASYSLAFLVFISYCSGLLMSYMFVKFRHQTSIYFDSLTIFYKSHGLKQKKKSINSCDICNDKSCKRHHPADNHAPWQDVIISEELNQAVEQLFSSILDCYISPWHKRLSNDEAFLHELKDALKYSTSAVIKRMKEIDLPTLISNKLLPCAIKHIDEFVYIQELAKLKNSPMDSVAIEHLGERLHRAAANRNSELAYLRELTKTLLPCILPKYSNCRNYSILFQEIVSGWLLLPMMDVISDPYIINSLIVIAANFSTQPTKNKEFSRKVQFLKSFRRTRNMDKSLFLKTLNEIKKDTELLYTFMQFLKTEDHVHLLQFHLDVDQFNDNFVTPQCSKSAFDELCEKAIKIHTEYKSRASANYINSDEENVESLVQLNDGKFDTNRIRNSNILAQVQKEVLEDLEENWLLLFYESNEFYKYLCGPKITAHYSKISTNKTKRHELVPSKLSSLGKIRSALKDSTPIDGSLLPQEKQSDIQIGYSIFRDISTWEIAITSYISLNKIIYFQVNIKRPNPVSSEMETHRVVLRKDQDFYILKAKLVEFHGEKQFANCVLPTRKVDSDIGTRMTAYEQFLKKLAQSSTLRGSDLLHTFLTTEEDFVMYISTCGTPVQDLENIYQTVAQKLRKEKGQHLDHFMNIYKATTRNEGKYASVDIVTEAVCLDKSPQCLTPPKTYRNCVFNDNFGVSVGSLRKTSNSAVTPENIVDCLFYLGKHIFKIPSVLLKVYVTICSVTRELVEFIWYALLQKELIHGLSQQHLKYLVTCLQEVILDDTSGPTTKVEQENQKKETLIILNNISLKFPYKLLSRNFFQGLQQLWQISQHPHYNKQLTYQLLDIILIELYPNIIVK